MQYLRKTNILMAAILAAVSIHAQDATAKDIKGLPPRATPADYQAQGKAGDFTIAAEFAGHSVPTPQAVLTTEDYIVVEVGLFGPADSHLKISFEDFSLRINGKKAPAPAQPYGMVFKSLKDPDWVAPTPAESKSSKTSIGSGGRGGQIEPNSPPPIVHIPIEVERAMEQRVQKAALPEGDRPLPSAGLIFFPHRGKTDNLHSLELIYSGPAGKAALTLQN